MQKINSEKETIVVTLKNIIKKINLPVIDIFKTKYLEGLKNFYNNTERPEVEGFKEFLENYIKEENGKITSTIFDFIAKYPGGLLVSGKVWIHQHTTR